MRRGVASHLRKRDFAGALDSTRVMAIIALVVSLLAVAVGSLLPAMLFGAFGGPGPGDVLPNSNAVGSFGGNVYQGTVAVTKDGSVAADVLATAVADASQDELLGPVTCDATPKVVKGVSVLCRSTERDQFATYAVVRFTDDTGQFETMIFTYGA